MPSALLFFSLSAYRSYYTSSFENILSLGDLDDDPEFNESPAVAFDHKLLRDSSMVVVFLIFMCCSKFSRASIRVLKLMMKKGKKNKIKQQKKLEKINNKLKNNEKVK